MTEWLWSLTSDYNPKTHEVGLCPEYPPEVLSFPYTYLMSVFTVQSSLYLSRLFLLNNSGSHNVADGLVYGV